MLDESEAAVCQLWLAKLIIAGDDVADLSSIGRQGLEVPVVARSRYQCVRCPRLAAPRMTFSALAAHLKAAALLGIVTHQTGDLQLADPVVPAETAPDWARGGRRV